MPEAELKNIALLIDADNASHNGIDAVLDLLGAAWKAARRDDDGFAKLQEVGQIAGNRSSFDVRNYGHKRLSDMIRSMSDNFKLERRDNQLFVKRLR